MFSSNFKFKIINDLTQSFLADTVVRTAWKGLLPRRLKKFDKPTKSLQTATWPTNCFPYYHQAGAIGVSGLAPPDSKAAFISRPQGNLTDFTWHQPFGHYIYTVNSVCTANRTNNLHFAYFHLSVEKVILILNFSNCSI